MRPTATAAAAVSISIDTSQTSINRDREMCVARTTDEATQQYNRGGRIKMVADNLSFNTGILNHEWRRRLIPGDQLIPIGSAGFCKPCEICPLPGPDQGADRGLMILRAYILTDTPVTLHTRRGSNARTATGIFGIEHQSCFEKTLTTHSNTGISQAKNFY
ncbi:hypothetical protein RRG08_005088 [Elysia crispata]|uniref:Uncharacterized protein n=1 Tax=Elysia crispata TaxID=231223 RepID=A0AAE0XZN6_9GAST|nr:hypothetical protein RRG08_005088 [Elysia crispata]